MECNANLGSWQTELLIACIIAVRTTIRLWSVIRLIVCRLFCKRESDVRLVSFYTRQHLMHHNTQNTQQLTKYLKKDFKVIITQGYKREGKHCHIISNQAQNLPLFQIVLNSSEWMFLFFKYNGLQISWNVDEELPNSRTIIWCHEPKIALTIW